MKPLCLLRCCLLLVLCALLTACTIEGGVPAPDSPGILSSTNTPVAATTPITDTATLTDTTAATTTVAITPTPQQEAYRTEFRIGLLDEPSDLLPYFSSPDDQRITAPISQLLFPTPLVAVNYTYTTTGVLERVPSLEDGGIALEDVTLFFDETGAITTTETESTEEVQRIVVTYHWNPMLRWSDGITVTADDSLFAYELAQQVPLGAEAERRLQLTERYERVDAYTTRAVLKPDFIDPASLRTFWAPLPRHLLKDIPPDELLESDFAFLPIGYGPYMLDRREQGSLRLRRNPYYSGPAPMADVVSFAFLSSVDDLRTALLARTLDVGVTNRITPEQIDILDSDTESNTLAVTYIPNQVWEHLDFNLDMPLLQNIGIRQAIAFGTNRQEMVDALYGGHTPVLESWVLPGHWAGAPPEQVTRYPHDSDKANSLLDEMGLIDNDGDGIRERDGLPITATLITTDGMPRTAIADMFQADMGSIGISVTIETMPIEQLYSAEGPLFRRNFELAQFAWIADADPRGREIWGCDGVPNEQNDRSGQNLTGWCFLDAHRAIISATTTLTRTAREEAYLHHQQLFTQELPVLPLFQRLDVVISNPNMRGLRPDPIAPVTWNIADWVRQ